MGNSMTSFQMQLASLINGNSIENESNTPDFVLAQYLRACLEAYNAAVSERDRLEMCDKQPTKELEDDLLEIPRLLQNGGRRTTPIDNDDARQVTIEITRQQAVAAVRELRDFYFEDCERATWNEALERVENVILALEIS